jgi:TetR/AcrR family transcriptional regulator
MPRPASDLGPRIVVAARKRFLTDGVDGASLRNIARDAGTNIGMIYYYFPTKDELFMAVLEAIYPQLLEDLTRALDGKQSVEDRLTALFVRFGQVSDDELEVMRIIVREVLVSSKRLGSVMERFMRGHAPLVIMTLADGVLSGKLDGGIHPAVLAVSTFALAMFPQMLRRLAGPKLPSGLEIPGGEQLSRALVHVLLHGIAKPDGPR